MPSAASPQRPLMSSALSSLRAGFATLRGHNSIELPVYWLGIREVLARTWFLGFISFGGPPVHFQIFRQRFVEGTAKEPAWIDEQTWLELFAINQALPVRHPMTCLWCSDGCRARVRQRCSSAWLSSELDCWLPSWRSSHGACLGRSACLHWPSASSGSRTSCPRLSTPCYLA
jgi:hypothetical protein